MIKMKEVDAIIISWAKDEKIKKVTDDMIKSLIDSEDDVKFNIYVVETNRNVSWDNYLHTKTIYPDVPFGYHRYLNIGVRASNSDYVCLMNSDLSFEKGWATRIIDEMEKDPTLLSASPLCPQVLDRNQTTELYYGYAVRQHLAGWCIFQQRKIYDILKELDERFIFWYADNDYSIQLQINRIKHALICKSIVNHHGENIGETGKTLDNMEMKFFTVDQQQVFYEKYDKYLKQNR